MVALKETLTQLPEDHANARILARGSMLFCCGRPLPCVLLVLSLQAVQTK